MATEKQVPEYAPPTMVVRSKRAERQRAAFEAEVAKAAPPKAKKVADTEGATESAPATPSSTAHAPSKRAHHSRGSR